MDAPFKAVLSARKGKFVRIERDVNEDERFKWGHVKEVDDFGCTLNMTYTPEYQKEHMLYHSEECWFYTHRDIRGVHWTDAI